MNFEESVFPRGQYFFLSGLCVFVLLLGQIGWVSAEDTVNVTSPSSQVQVTEGKQASRFMGRYADVCGLARELAQKPFTVPALIPNVLRSLPFDQWSRSSYKQKVLQSIKGKFQVRPIVAGSIYETEILLYGFDGEKSYPLRTYANEFNLPESVIQTLPPEISQLAGFQLLNTENQKLLFEFLGATYFRGAAAGTFGTSTLGLCLLDENLTMTVFPRFTTFWIVPEKEQKGFRLLALMDSSFVTGAYEFSFPYKTLAYIQVRCAFFKRSDALPKQTLGIAPLVSMFLQGTGQTDHIHSADTLLAKDLDHTIAVPLGNPQVLERHTYYMNTLRAFGLIQRDRTLTHYASGSNDYVLRPSVRVYPSGDWGKGKLVLAQFPSNNPINNNIFTYWVPDSPQLFSPSDTSSEPVSYQYDIVWNRAATLDRLAHVSDSRVLFNEKDNTVTFSVTFTGNLLAAIPKTEGLSSEILCPGNFQPKARRLEKVSGNSWTLTFTHQLTAEQRQGNGITTGLPMLRFGAFLKRGDNLPQPLTETWSYDFKR